MCFNTGYNDSKGELIMNQAMIRRNYLKTWFPIDFVSNLPIDAIIDLGILIIISFLRCQFFRRLIFKNCENFKNTQIIACSKT
jgi:hypothetical protein